MASKLIYSAILMTYAIIAYIPSTRSANVAEFIMYSNGIAINFMHLDPVANPTPPYSAIPSIEASPRIAGLAYDYANNFIFYSEAVTYKIYRVHPDGSNRQLIVENIKTFGMEWDYINNQLYYTDRETGQVHRYSPESRSTELLIDSSRFRGGWGIALNIEEYTMYWGDDDVNPELISKASMDGGNVTTITSDVGWPNGMTINLYEKRLYWIDSLTDKLESTDLEGGDRKEVFNLIETVATSHNNGGFDIYNNTYYWTDTSNKWVVRLDKDGNVIKLAENVEGTLWDLKVFAKRVFEWREWSDWTKCDQPCDSGLQTRKRTCDDPAGLGGVFNCTGNPMETRSCNTDACSTFEVACDDTHMAVWFNKIALDERDNGDYNNRTWQIYFEGQRDDSSCTTYHWDATRKAENYEGLSNPETMNSSFFLGAPINNCGINRFADDKHIIYNATVIVTYGQNPNDFIHREEYDKYNVMCLRNRTVEQKDSLSVQYRETGLDAKNDTEELSFTFGHTDINGESQSVYHLGDYIKFNMTSKTKRTEVKAVIQRCWTTSDGSANSYNLIENRCKMEPGTSWVAPPSDAVSVFKTEAFRYLGSSDNNIYAECLVRVCLDTQKSDECKLCGSSDGRRRRNAENETNFGQMVLVKTPTFYIIGGEAPTQGKQKTSNVLSGTNGVILIIVLAFLVFVISVAVIKKLFFNKKAPSVDVPVVAYVNKAMA